jgi:hypothetical protein
MCDSKCFWTINPIDNFLIQFQKDVNAIEKYIIDDIAGPTGVVNIVKNKVFNVTSFDVGLKTGLATNMNIKSNYLQYILTYGLPADGIFDPVLLAEFD